MNERIFELAKQADLIQWDTLPSGARTPDHERGVKAKKFAELIVRDCMNQVREQYLPVLEDEVMMKDTHWDGYVQCGVDSYVAIREYFYGEEGMEDQPDEIEYCPTCGEEWSGTSCGALRCGWIEGNEE